MNIRFTIAFVVLSLSATGQKEQGRLPAALHGGLDHVKLDKASLKPVGKDVKLVFGLYCGMCTEHCATMYCYRDIRGRQRLSADTTDRFFDDEKNMVFSVKSKKEKHIALCSDIAEQIPEEIRNAAPGKRFGCPDCTDQCGIYFEFTEGQKKKFVYLDTDPRKLTPEVKAFTLLLSRKLQKLNAN